MDDKALVQAVVGGNLAAFEQLVRQYQAGLVASACHLTRRVDDAEDLAQETLVEAFRQLRSLREPEKFRGWLFAILRNKCLNFLKRDRSELLLEDCGDLVAAPASLDDGEVAELLNRLPLPDREVLAARYLHGLEYAEIGDALGITMHTAEMRCSRARERLRHLMQQADEERTRLLMQRAMGAVLVGGISATFTERVLHDVSMISMLPAAVHGVAGQGLWSQVAAYITGWKVAAGIIAVLALAGAGVVWQAAHHRARPVALDAAALHPYEVDPAIRGTLRNVQGRVVTPDGKPLTGARVAWIGRSTGHNDFHQLASVKTDSKGKFSFPNANALWEKSGWSRGAQLMVETKEWALTFSDIPESILPVTIKLERPTTLQVAFVDQQNTPVAKLPVTMRWIFFRGPGTLRNHQLQGLPDPRQRYTRRTDSKGLCTFTNLPRHGTASLLINDDRFVQLRNMTPTDPHNTLADNINLIDAAVTPTVSYRLLPAASIEGTVTYAITGKPAAGVHVRALPDDTHGVEAVTDAQGHYHITQLNQGNFRVLVNDDVVAKSWVAAPYASVPVTLGGQVTGINFSLVTGAIITGKVTAEDTGEPIAQVAVSISNFAHPEIPWGGTPVVTTGVDGSYRCHVMPGKYSLRLYCVPPAPGFLPPRKNDRNVTASVDATAIVNFTLPRK